MVLHANFGRPEAYSLIGIVQSAMLDRHANTQQPGNGAWRVHLQGLLVVLLVWGLVSKEVAGDLAAGANEPHNVGVEGQLALQVHLLLEQLKCPAGQPCITYVSDAKPDSDHQATRVLAMTDKLVMLVSAQQCKPDRTTYHLTLKHLSCGATKCRCKPMLLEFKLSKIAKICRVLL